MTDRERAELAQDHDINDDQCEKHGEPLYASWCKSCVGEAITQACAELQAQLAAVTAERDKYYALLDGAEYENLDRLYSVEFARVVGKTVQARVVKIIAERDELRERLRQAEAALAAAAENGSVREGSETRDGASGRG